MPNLLRVILLIRTNIESLGECPTHNNHFNCEEGSGRFWLLMTSDTYISEIL